MIKINDVLIVEGRYDKNTLSQIVDADIVETCGFGIFSDRDKLALIRRIANVRPVVILTDSDGAGMMIRNYLKGALPPGQVKHAYIPQVAGKDTRKRKTSKSGLLGVESFDRETLVGALLDAGVVIDGCKRVARGGGFTKTDMYMLGLSGGKNSRTAREALLKKLNLPLNLNSNGLLSVLNILYTPDELRRIMDG